MAAGVLTTKRLMLIRCFIFPVSYRVAHHVRLCAHPRAYFRNACQCMPVLSYVRIITRSAVEVKSQLKHVVCDAFCLFAFKKSATIYLGRKGETLSTDIRTRHTTILHHKGLAQEQLRFPNIYSRRTMLKCQSRLTVSPTDNEMFRCFRNEAATPPPSSFLYRPLPPARAPPNSPQVHL